MRIEPYVIPKKSLTGDNTERVDTRVLQVIYAVDGGDKRLFVGQQVDVFVDASAPAVARCFPALHVLEAELLDLGGPGGERSPRRLAEHGLARLGELLQALGQVHGVTDDGVLDPLLRTEEGGGHVTGREPDAEAERRAGPPPPTAR